MWFEMDVWLYSNNPVLVSNVCNFSIFIEKNVLFDRSRANRKIIGSIIRGKNQFDDCCCILFLAESKLNATYGGWSKSFTVNRVIILTKMLETEWIEKLLTKRDNKLNFSIIVNIISSVWLNTPNKVKLIRTYCILVTLHTRDCVTRHKLS